MSATATSTSNGSPWIPSVGNRVKVQGLQGRADLNGRIGRVIERYNTETERVGVRVYVTFAGDQAEDINIKPVNLKEDPAIFLDGFEVIESGEEILGRIAVASRNYAMGDTFLVEAPTYVFDPQQGVSGMIQNYLDSSEDERSQILDMYCPHIPTTSSGEPDETQQETSVVADKDADTRERLLVLEHQWGLFVQKQPSVRGILPIQTAKKLLRIIDVNAHNYSYQTTGGMVATDSALPQEHNALFARGSKVEHSCAPNMIYTTASGKLQYTAARSVRKGERLSISYHTAGFGRPRKQRQEFLQANKDFTCQCRRCVGPDECSPYVITCPNCNNQKAVVFSYQNDDNFQCTSCQSQIPSSSVRRQQEMEEIFDQKLSRIDHNLQMGAFRVEPTRAISQAVQLVNDVSQTMHPFHWLHPKGYQILSSLVASLTRMYLRQGKSPKKAPVQNLLYLSTMALLHKAQWVQQAGAIIYQEVLLNEVVKHPWIPATFSVNPSLNEVQGLTDQLCGLEDSNCGSRLVMDMAHPLFQAGQDWLLAGDPVPVAHLYKSFLQLFLRWNRLGDDSRERMAILVNSCGARNTFPNHLMN